MGETEVKGIEETPPSGKESKTTPLRTKYGHGVTSIVITEKSESLQLSFKVPLGHVPSLRRIGGSVRHRVW